MINYYRYDMILNKEGYDYRYTTLLDIMVGGLNIRYYCNYFFFHCYYCYCCMTERTYQITVKRWDRQTYCPELVYWLQPSIVGCGRWRYFLEVSACRTRTLCECGHLHLLGLWTNKNGQKLKIEQVSLYSLTLTKWFVIPDHTFSNFRYVK